MKRSHTSQIFKLLMAGILLSACRGTPSTKPPIHPNQNMDFSEAFESQEKNTFFEDRRAMRPKVQGTVARGFLIENTALQLGKDENGNFVKTLPLHVDRAFIERGAEKYRIFCSPCHGGVGDGKGAVVAYGLVPPPSYHDERLRNVEDGYFFDVITNGVRSMYGYESQIPKVEDRWAIVAYIRALQKSQYATESDLGGYTLTQEERDRYKTAEAAAKEAKEREAAKIASMSIAELVKMGAELYKTKTCATCHSLDGTKLIGPSFKGSYNRTVEFTDGTKTIADDAYLTESIVNSNAKIVKDYIPAMPNFSDLLTDVEVKALVEYIKTVQ